MARLLTLVLFLSQILGGWAVTMDEKFAALPGGTQLIGPRGIEEFALRGKGGTAETVRVAGQPFVRAVRIVTTVKPDANYKLQLSSKSVAPVTKGDRLLAAFWARAVPPLPGDGEARSEFCFELGEAPYTKCVEWPFAVGSEWRRFYVPFEAALDIAAGRAGVHFRAGYDPQTIEIGGVEVIDFGPDFPREKLPYTPASYAGRDPDAPWRKSAAERIERIRKAALKITVTDANGKPLPGAEVTVRMKRHAFGWGSAVDAKTLLRQDQDGERYRRFIVENFNRVVIENDLKWSGWEKDPKRAIEAVTWLREHGLDVRGHCLVWPGIKNLPEHVHPLLKEPEALQRLLLEHIAEEAGALRGQLIEWDVVNEPFTNFDVQVALSGIAPGAAPDAVERHASTLAALFRAARAADPDVKLDINDYSILATGGRDAAHQEHYERTIRQLLRDGAPLGGIGMQGHFSEDLTAIPRLWEILDRFGQFGLPIQITEFDINTWDEALQADYTRDFLTAMFAHESVISVLTWGFWEGRHWIPNAAFFRADWSLRPAGQAWLDLVQKHWRTNADGITDARGEWTGRAFRGDYEITASAGGKAVTAKATLPGNGAEVRLSVR